MNVKRRDNIAIWGANTGMMMLLVAGVMPLLRAGVAAPVWRWLYAAGAATVLAARILQPKDAPTLRARRLKRMELWSALVWAVGVFFIFWPGAGPTDWIAFFLAGGVLEAYASLAMPAALRSKDNRGEKKK